MNRNTTILLIDDEENYLFIIKELLTEEGYTVQTCNDPTLALLLLEKENYDIVITDVKMPKCSGSAVAERVHALYPETPIIVITAFGSIENAISFMKEGVFHYLTKPFENDELIRTVHNASELVFTRKQYKELYNSIHGKDQEQYPLVGHSKAMKHVIDFVHSIKESTAPILIEGEAGVGKTYLAYHIHSQSVYYHNHVHLIDIETLADEELEALFCGENSILGRKEESIILHGLEHLSYSMQVKLFQHLDALQQGNSARIFSTTTISIEDLVKEGKFHVDLFYMLSVLRVSVPPLRERRDDIGYLAVAIMSDIIEEERSSTKYLSAEVIRYFTHYEWYGNVKELRTILKRIIIMNSEEEIGIQHLPTELQEEQVLFTSAIDLLPISLNLSETLEKIEEQLIRRALVHCNFVQARAAALLGISKSRLQYKLMKYEISGHQLHY